MRILNPHVKIWALPVVKNAEEASSWDYTETINNEMIAEKEISAEGYIKQQ